jgi:hypothetical protein
MTVPPLIKVSFDFRAAHESFESAKALRAEALARYKEALAPKIGKKLLASFQASAENGRFLEETKEFEHVTVLVAKVMDEFVQVGVVRPEGGICYALYENFTVHNELD